MKYHLAGQRRRARLHAVRYRDGEGFALSGSEGVLAHRPRDSARFEICRRHGAERVAVGDSRIPAEPATGFTTRSTRLGTRVLRALALHIDLPENYFDDKTNFGNSILRPIHYPPITAPDVPNVRAGAHEDINLITLLVGASAEGLEVQFAHGRVGAVHRGSRHDRRQHRRHAAAPDQPRVSVDDASRRQSAERERAQAALFGAVLPAPESGFRDRRAASCVDATHPSRYPQPITAHEYLQERLREIKLI